MSLDVSKVARTLSSAIAVDEYIASEIVGREAIESLQESAEGVFHKLHAQLFIDRKRGRGSAAFLPGASSPLARQIHEASTRAYEALGPAWRLPQPAAPARVLAHDPSESRGVKALARALLDRFHDALPKTVQPLAANVRVRQAKHRTILSCGFDNRYLSTNIWLEATIQSAGGSPVPLRLRARRFADITQSLGDAIERAKQHSLGDVKATPLPAGEVDLVLVHSAYLPRSSNDFGIWTPLVQQAQASRVRAGISTHTPGQPLFEKAMSGDALSIRSEGTKPYALRCAPFSTDGQAVRNFSLAKAGMATGVAIGHRDAALGLGTANGGVRRLVVEGGSQSIEELGRPQSRPLLFVQVLGALEVTAHGGLFLDVASAELRKRDALGRATKSPVRSAMIAGTLRDWHARVVASQDMSDDSWLHGPTLMRINKVQTQ